MPKFEAEKKQFLTNPGRPGLVFLAVRGEGGRLETSYTSLILCNLTRSPPRRGAADVFGIKNDPWTLQGRLDGLEKRRINRPLGVQGFWTEIHPPHPAGVASVSNRIESAGTSCF